MIDRLKLLIDELGEKLPLKINLAINKDHMQVMIIAEKMLDKVNLSFELDHLEKEIYSGNIEYSEYIHLALKLARSKYIISQLSEKIHITFISALYYAPENIGPDIVRHDLEDFLRYKTEQIRWLSNENRNISWELLLVDDGCPNNSGEIVSLIISEKYSDTEINVLYLKDGIKKGNQIVSQLHNTDESVIGGSVEYGMWYACEQCIQNHIVVYVESSSSIHLGQSGLLLERLIHDNKNVATGSVFLETSMYKPGKQDKIEATLYAKFLKKIVPQLDYLNDLQTGFKAFKSDILKEILTGTIEKRLAFDIELLLRSELSRHLSICEVPIFKSGTLNNYSSGYQMYMPDLLKNITQLYNKYLPENDETEACIDLISKMDQDSWKNIINGFLLKIKNEGMFDYDTLNEFNIMDLRNLFR